MTKEDRQGYVLGRNVTEQARAHERRGTVVLSVRLSGEEFDALANFAESQEWTVSQAARAAVQQWLARPQRATHSAFISFPSGSTAYFGDIVLGTAGAEEARTEPDLDTVAPDWVLSR